MRHWKYFDEEFKAILHRNEDKDNETGCVQATIAELVPHLRETPCFFQLPESIISQIKEAKTFHSLNQALDGVYDFADEFRIWLGM